MSLVTTDLAVDLAAVRKATRPLRPHRRFLPRKGASYRAKNENYVADQRGRPPAGWLLARARLAAGPSDWPLERGHRQQTIARLVEVTEPLALQDKDAPVDQTSE